MPSWAHLPHEGPKPARYLPDLEILAPAQFQVLRSHHMLAHSSRQLFASFLAFADSAHHPSLPDFLSSSSDPAAGARPERRFMIANSTNIRDL